MTGRHPETMGKRLRIGRNSPELATPSKGKNKKNGARGI